MNETYLLNRNLFNKSLIYLIKSRVKNTLVKYCRLKSEKSQSNYTCIYAL